MYIYLTQVLLITYPSNLEMKDWIGQLNRKTIPRYLLFGLTSTVIIIIWFSITSEENLENSFKYRKEIYLQNIKNRKNSIQELNGTIDNLSILDRSIVKRCGVGYRSGSVAQLERICSPEMKFLSTNKSRNLTALVSFPGSGNTWVRQLLEEVTGVYTGSIYCDSVLKISGFLGENITSSSVMVIKTHVVSNTQIKRDPKNQYNAGIFLIRDIRDTLISETHRRWTKNHTELADNNQFRNYTLWSDLVYHLTKRWEVMIKTWLKKESHILVVRYEDLKTDLANQIKRMLSFLNFNYTQEQIDCVINTNQNTFQRPSAIDEKEKYAHYYYTLELEKIIKLTLDNVRPILNRYGVNYG